MTWWNAPRSGWLVAAGGTVLALACGASEDKGDADANGGAATGGATNGGTVNGGSATGGATNGGSATGGAMNGGSATGGSVGDGGESGDGTMTGGVSGTAGGAGVAGATTGGAGGTAGAGVGGKGGAAGSGGASGAGSGGASGAGGGTSGGTGGAGAEDRPNGSACTHGGLCLSGHCRGGLCDDPPSWGAVTNLAATGGAPSVAMGAFGDAAVVWRDDPTDRVLGRVALGKVFGAETRIDTQGGAVSVSDPKVAFTGGQSFLATWSESFTSMDYRVFGRPYSAGWGGSNDIDGASSSMQLPRIATDPNGNGAVVWNGRDDSFVWMRQVTGANLGTPSNFSYGDDQAVGVSPSGRVAIAWCVTVTGTADLWVAAYAPGQGWGAPMRAYEGVPAGACYDPVIAIADNGDMAVTWMDGPSVGRPYARAYTAASGWETSTLIEPGIIYGSVSPLPVFSVSGALLLVWYRIDTGVSSCDVRYRLRLGGAWTPNQTLDECEQGSGFLAAASYDSESFRVIYHRGAPNVSGRELWDARYVGGQGFRDRRSISPVANVQLSPQLALDRSGRGLLAWSYRLGSQTNDPRELRAMWLE